jgi:hypothetical protein
MTLNIRDGACRRLGDGLKRRRYAEGHGTWHGRLNQKAKLEFNNILLSLS